MTITYRTLTTEDKYPFFELIKQVYLEEFGQIAMSADETREFSGTPDYSLTEDTLLAIQDDRMVGYISVWALGDTPVHPDLHFYVMPDARGGEIEARLLQWGIERAKHVYERLPSEARVVACVKMPFRALDASLEQLGFSSKRHMLRMRIDFDSAPPEPQFPDGFRIVTMANHPHLIDFVRVYRNAFRDLRGFTNDSLENRLARWQRDLEVHKDHFRPEYFALLKDGDQDAGVIMAWETSRFDLSIGWVSILGVLPNYRRQGLASNLLYHIFTTMYNNGRAGVGLSVDGSSLTGANKLYEKVGMRPFVSIKSYELELRAGIEYSNQGQKTP